VCVFILKFALETVIRRENNELVGSFSRIVTNFKLFHFAINNLTP